MPPFRPPRGCTGFNIDDTPADRRTRTDLFHRWGRALAQSMDQRAEPAPSTGNYDILRFDGTDLWLLHNRFVPVTAAITQPPEAGFAFAVVGTFVDIDIPHHLTAWGPTPIPAADLNRTIVDEDWTHFSPPARTHADRLKPTTVGHILFNHWD